MLVEMLEAVEAVKVVWELGEVLEHRCSGW